MSRQNWKKVILLILVAIAAYIWWGNVQSFYSQSAINPNPEETTSETIQSSEQTLSLTYMPPGFNPFFKGTVRTRSNGASDNPSKLVPQIPKPPSTGHILTGFVTETKTPQVIILGPSKSSYILTIGDTLDDWHLSRIDNNSVTFKFGALYDTLFLSSEK